MKDIQRAKKFLKEREGISEKYTKYLMINGERTLVHYSYDDPKKIRTIGYGCNLTVSENKNLIIKMGLNYERIFSGLDYITDQQAEKLLESNIISAVKFSKSHLKNGIFDNTLNANQQIAVVSLAFGSRTLLGPEITAALNKGDHLAVAEQILKKSNANRNSEFGEGIQNRREMECKIYLEGMNEIITASDFKISMQMKVSAAGGFVLAVSIPISSTAVLIGIGGIALGTAAYMLYLRLKNPSEKNHPEEYEKAQKFLREIQHTEKLYHAALQNYKDAKNAKDLKEAEQKIWEAEQMIQHWHNDLDKLGILSQPEQEVIFLTSFITAYQQVENLYRDQYRLFLQIDQIKAKRLQLEIDKYTKLIRVAREKLAVLKKFLAETTFTATKTELISGLSNNSNADNQVEKLANLILSLKNQELRDELIGVIIDKNTFLQDKYLYLVRLESLIAEKPKLLANKLLFDDIKIINELYIEFFTDVGLFQNDAAAIYKLTNFLNISAKSSKEEIKSVLSPLDLRNRHYSIVEIIKILGKNINVNKMLLTDYRKNFIKEHTLSNYSPNLNIKLATSDKGFFVIACEKTIQLWLNDSEKSIKKIDVGFQIDCVKIISEGKFIACAGAETIKVFDVETSACVSTFSHLSDSENKAVHDVAQFDNRLVSYCGTVIKIWDLKAKRNIKDLDFKINNNGIGFLFIDADKLICTGHSYMNIWDLNSGRVLQSIKTHEVFNNACAATTTCALLLSEKEIITGSDGNCVRIWDIEKGSRSILVKHSPQATSIQKLFLQQNNILIGNHHAEIKFWDLQSGHLIKSFNSGHTSAIVDMAMTSDGKLLTAAYDGQVKLWEFPVIEIPLDFRPLLIAQREQQLLKMEKDFSNQFIYMRAHNDSNNNIELQLKNCIAFIKQFIWQDMVTSVGKVNQEYYELMIRCDSAEIIKIIYRLLNALIPTSQMLSSTYQSIPRGEKVEKLNSEQGFFADDFISGFEFDYSDESISSLELN